MWLEATVVGKPCWLENVVFPCPCLPHRWFFRVAFHFLRYHETQRGIRAVTSQPCHLTAAFPPLPLPEVVFAGRWQSWVCVPPAGLALQDQPQPPLQRVCAGSGISTRSFCSTLQQGSSCRQWEGRCELIVLPRAAPLALCTLYVSAAEITWALLSACSLPPAR